MRNATTVFGGFLFLTLSSLTSQAHASELSKLTKAVRILKPTLSPERTLSYALGALTAGRDYAVDPFLLLSIAFQESSLRERLPKGPAGELGLCQVIESWAANPRFAREFGNVTEADFLTPSKNFRFAAWILSTLNQERGLASTELPSWTYFNARAKAPRLRYYMKVKRHILAMGRSN